MNEQKKAPRRSEGQNEFDGSKVATESSPSNGGWFATSKRDRRQIIAKHPEHAGALILIWTELLDEANRVHSNSFKLTRAQLAHRCGVSVSLVNYRLKELTKMKLVKTSAKMDPKTRKFKVATITIKPSVSASTTVARTHSSGDGKPCPLEVPQPSGQHITTFPSSGGERLVNKKDNAFNASSGLTPDGAPKASGISFEGWE
ncbi:winged helix-turn-helix domain-containing protein [Kiritimatiellota bacterium B12222]|nr:winged helix-turn-helix domain-containing protein [Kiritimatiellota bacterium B12222]